MTADVFRVPTLTHEQTRGAISHVLGDLEVIQLGNGALFRICEPDEAVLYYPRRSANLPPRPMRRVEVVDR